MQLINILLIAVAILTILSGFATLVGTRKNDKVQAALWFIATLGAALWSISVAVFLGLSPENSGMIEPVVVGIYIPAIVMDVCLLGHVGWQYRLGKVLTVFSALCGAFLAVALLCNHNLLYSTVDLTTSGNVVHITNDWYYWAYSGYFILNTIAFLGVLLYKILHTKERSTRKGLVVFLAGLSFAGALSLIFDVILPFGIRYDLIWVGPLSIGVTMILAYYAVLRYRILVLDNNWLKVLSYIIIMTSAAMIYMIIFFLIFTALFKVPNPSASIFVLNFIMVAIVLLLIPVINELSSFIRSLIQTNQVDIAYIIKRMNKMAPSNVNLNELSGFLADHLHFSYIGLIVKNKLYGSTKLTLTRDQLKMIGNLPEPERGIWLSFNEPVSELCRAEDINAIAELRDAKGQVFGQILVGKPLGKMGFDHKDLIQLEMIVNLVAAMIDTGAK